MEPAFIQSANSPPTTNDMPSLPYTTPSPLDDDISSYLADRLTGESMPEEDLDMDRMENILSTTTVRPKEIAKPVSTNISTSTTKAPVDQPVIPISVTTPLPPFRLMPTTGMPSIQPTSSIPIYPTLVPEKLVINPKAGKWIINRKLEDKLINYYKIMWTHRKDDPSLYPK